MHLDVGTLMVASAFVSILAAAVLLTEWWQFRESAALWWAGAYVFHGLGVGLLVVGAESRVLPLFLAGLTFLCCGPVLIWTGARAADGRKAVIPLIAAGPALWIASAVSVDFHGHIVVPQLAHAAITFGYLAAGAWELGRTRDVLKARLPLRVLLTLHGAVSLLSVPGALQGALKPIELPPLTGIFGLIHFEAYMYIVGTAIFLAIFMREISESKHRLAANTDLLTGLPNRRAFQELVSRLIMEPSRPPESSSIAILDLDNFKSINDNFGHGIGDVALQVFASAITRHLPRHAIAGRLGGEEFGVLFPGADTPAALRSLEQMRKTFEAEGASIGGRGVNATVSAGLAMVQGSAPSLDETIARADQALYQAKRNGKNRVEVDGQATSFRLLKTA